MINKGYTVHGIVRRVALDNQTHRLWRIKHLLEKINLHSASLESYASICKIVSLIKPDEVYHLAAQSYVDYSFEDEFSTLNTNINGTHYILSALKVFSPDSKFYFAGSSEMFGKTKQIPQDENTPFHPRSAYGISKVAGFDLTRNYREGYNLHASSGILFNHESPRRGYEFVTRKISLAAANIKLGLQKNIFLGNVNAKRDWGHAKDYVEAMWLILQQDKPDDYVIGTGETHSVKEFIKLAFETLDLNYADYLIIDKKLFRPSEVNLLLSNNSKARNKLNWQYKITFKELVKEMVLFDYNSLKKS